MSKELIHHLLRMMNQLFFDYTWKKFQIQTFITDRKLQIYYDVQDQIAIKQGALDDKG
ncbi:hypothetical protein [Paenibacillus sp. NPDC057934]|uniref:hypothetical protein n=1 Tax=Paenibacillus sp. NPDC057934 TaxID=3346282 RepID=UPI0036DBC233